jgi:AmmeMemoRadiSam system protein A
MNYKPLTDEERAYLLRLARRTIELGVAGKRLPELNVAQLSPALAEWGASFVTLTERDGALRGCIGALEAYQALAEDVREHALAAALEDYRFEPVRPAEVPLLRIEISRLTPTVPLVYDGPDDLLRKLRPGVDGVVLSDGVRRATFLPQVWQKLPDPVQFLGNLCNKMGASTSLWRRQLLTVLVYQVEEFAEEP